MINIPNKDGTVPSFESIKQSPEYTEEALLTWEYETELHRHYNLPGYWLDEPVAK